MRRSRGGTWGTLLLLCILAVAPGVYQPAKALEIKLGPLLSGLGSKSSHKRALKADDGAPQPSIITPSPLGSQSTILLGISFGGKVTATDPNSLFSLGCTNCPPGSTGSGASKVDTLLDVNKGMLYISIQVADPKAAAVLQVSVPAGVTTNVDGQPNSAATPAPLSYMPASSGAAAVGGSMATMFQAAWPASIVASAAGAVSPSVVADISNRALMTTLVGSIALPSMPPIYSSFSSPMGFVKLDAA
jgi:hypothetical protein